jgi:hypothetical protein
MISYYYRFSTSGENRAHRASKRGCHETVASLEICVCCCFSAFLAGSKGERQWQSAYFGLVETLSRLFTYRYVVTSSRRIARTMPRERNLVPLIRNNNGGYYQPGCRYDFRTKMEVATVFADLCQVGVPAIPQISHVAKVAKVRWTYAAKVVDVVVLWFISVPVDCCRHHHVHVLCAWQICAAKRLFFVVRENNRIIL